MILFKSCYILVTKFQFSTFFDKEFLKQTDPKKKSDPPENNFEICRSTGKSGRHKLATTSCRGAPTKTGSLATPSPFHSKGERGRGHNKHKVLATLLQPKWHWNELQCLENFCNLFVAWVSGVSRKKRGREKQTRETVKVRKLLGTPPDW